MIHQMATHALVLALTLIATHCSKITRRAVLDANNLHSNGASITELADVYPNYNCGGSNIVCWGVYAATSGNQGFHLQLSLNASWTFSTFAQSTLRLDIAFNAKTAASYRGRGQDLLVIFAPSDPTNRSNGSFLPIRLDLDMDDDHT